ncbi:hypothetical protein C1926_19605 [Stenotrophomonas sp. ZAC14A_NAIMI4_1]|nr:hypothetical protein C1926_19605 [Stenotrophomonas sp. ZAC14A_NAIMI4_1]
MDGFTASPHTHSAPPSHGMPLLPLMLTLTLTLTLTLIRQVQGAALPKNPTNETRVTARNTRATS